MRRTRKLARWQPERARTGMPTDPLSEPHYPPPKPTSYTREWYRANGGLTAVRRDWRHFCRVHGARTPFERFMVALSSRSLWALAVYRYGRWTYSIPSRLLSLPFKLAYHLAYIAGQHTSKVAIDVNANVCEDVFIAPVGLVFIGPDVRVGPGSFIHGQVTLGVGGRPGARGLPLLGDRVHVGPGSMLVGPLSVPDDTVIGPNSVVTRTLPAAGGWVGSPAKPYAGSSADLMPNWTGTWRKNGPNR